MANKRQRRAGGTDFVTSPPVATDGGFDQVCQITPYSVSGATPPALGGEFHDRVYDKQALRVQTLGRYGDFTVRQDLVPGTFATTKFSKSNSTDFTNCIEPKVLSGESRYLPYTREVAELVDTESLEEIIDDIEDRPKNVLFTEELPASEYRYALKAFDGVLPRALFEGAVISDAELLRDHRGESLRTYHKVLESNFHRDGIDTAYGWSPIGQMLVFEPIDSDRPAKTITTEWVKDNDREKLYHSMPLSGTIETPNTRMTRYFLYQKNEVVERVFPGMLLPNHSEDPEEVSTDDLVNVNYVGGGKEIYLNPGERLVQTANIIPRLINKAWVEENWSLLYPEDDRVDWDWARNHYGLILRRAEELGLEMPPHPFEAEYESVPADFFPSQAKPPQQPALAGDAQNAPPPPKDLPALEDNAEVMLSEDYQEESSNGKSKEIDENDLKYIRDHLGYRDGEISPLLPNETGVVGWESPWTPNLYVVRSKDGKRWWQYNRDVLVGL
jgi:hypothetical protein